MQHQHPTPCLSVQVLLPGRHLPGPCVGTTQKCMRVYPPGRRLQAVGVRTEGYVTQPPLCGWATLHTSQTALSNGLPTARSSDHRFSPLCWPLPLPASLSAPSLLPPGPPLTLHPSPRLRLYTGADAKLRPVPFNPGTLSQKKVKNQAPPFYTSYSFRFDVTHDPPYF